MKYSNLIHQHIAAFGLLVLSTTNTGCKSEDGPVDAEVNSWTVEVQRHEDCINVNIPDSEKPKFCSETVQLHVDYKVVVGDNQTLKLASDDVVFTFAEGELTATQEVIVPSEVVDQAPGAYLTWFGYTLDTDQGFEDCGNGNVRTFFDVLPNNSEGDTGGELDMGPDVCAKFTIDKTGGNTGSGFGAVCMQAFDVEAMSLLDPNNCVFKVDGQIKPEGTLPQGETCDGYYVSGLTANTHTFGATCDDGTTELTGSVVTGVKDDTTTSVVIEVSDPNAGDDTTTGDGDTGEEVASICVTAVNSQGTPLAGCDYEIAQEGSVTSDPVPMGVVCDAGSLYLERDPGQLTIAAFCPNTSGETTVDFVAGQHQTVDLFTYAPVSEGSLCTVDWAYSIGTNDEDARLNVQAELGIGENGGCNPNVIDDYTEITVISLTGPGCAQLGAPGCRLTPVGNSNDPLVNGVYAHLLWAFDPGNMDPDQLDIYTMGIEHSGLGQSIERNVWVKNGVIQGF